MAGEPIRRQISREVKRALSDARLSARAAAGRMPKGPGGKPQDAKLIYRWINEEVTAPLDRLEEFAAVVGPISLTIGGTEKEALRPDWAEGLETRTAQAVIDLLATPIQMDAAVHGLERLVALQRQSSEADDAETGSPNPAAVEP